MKRSTSTSLYAVADSEQVLGNETGSPRRSIFPNANSRAAISAGRALLDRPRAAPTQGKKNPATSTPFTASAADTPLPRLSTEPALLKSCLSSSNVLAPPSVAMKNSSQSLANEVFQPRPIRPRPIKRNVSFSHLQVREYDVTLGCNPSVSSGLPVSLDWSYDPRERVAPVDAFEAVRVRRNSSDLLLSDRQRQGLLTCRPDVTYADVARVLQDVAAARLERKMSRNELLEERQRERSAVALGRREMRSRRMGGL